MRDFLAIAGAIVGIAVVAVLVFAATKPDAFRIERSIAIKAPPEKIFPYLNDLHNFAQWSPYEKKDLGMKKTFSGPPSGTGAAYAWDGDKNVGAGQMTIADSAPPSKLAIKLDMLKPFEAHNDVAFTLTPSGDSTTVTWAMSGISPYLAKVMTTFFSMDKMVGKDFEDGLVSLKTLAEK